MANKKHILMIDDDSTIQRLMGSRLAKAGYEILYAQDGPTGREIARRLHPDLILLDIHLGDDDGFALAKRLHEEKETKDTPVVFLTNDDISLEAEKWVKELWVLDYIHKSMEPKEFVNKIRKILPLDNPDPNPYESDKKLQFPK